MIRRNFYNARLEHVDKPVPTLALMGGGWEVGEPYREEYASR